MYILPVFQKSVTDKQSQIKVIVQYIYRPQTKFAKVMFSQVSVCPQGGRAWLLPGGVRGCSQGGCVVAPRGGHVWLLGGGMHGCSWGACMVAPGGHVWLLPGGHVWLLQGYMRGCSGGCAWLLQGGVHGCSRGGMHGCSWGACMVAPGGGMRGFFNEIWSMSRRYASYWNAFLF